MGRLLSASKEMTKLRIDARRDELAHPRPKILGGFDVENISVDFDLDHLAIAEQLDVVNRRTDLRQSPSVVHFRVLRPESDLLISRDVPGCAMAPSFMTATRSAMVMASIRSWVT